MKKQVCFTVALFSAFITGNQSFAQQNTSPRCGIDEIYEREVKTHPELLEHRAAGDAYTNFYMENPELFVKKFQKTSAGSSTASKYIIPTVVHVVHTGKGQPDSISAAQVNEEFRRLFENYRRVPGTYGYGAGGDTYIEFCLCTKDPNGNPHTGINYVRNPDLSNLSQGDENIPLKELIRWDTQRYFNVWIVKSISTTGQFTALAGYAQFPSDNLPTSYKTDGVVVIAEDWGGDASNTAAHELGHWVNLYHPFQGACPNANCNTQGDNVCDTPPVVDADFKSIALRNNTCTSDFPDMADISRIYMDYVSDDKQCNIFTPKQVKRANLAMENESWPRRYSLWQEENVQATGTGKYKAPIANFWTSHQNGCVGQPITFYDYSRNQAQEYWWEFPGGTPATSNDPQPVVTYAQPGSYSAKLKVRNLSGVMDSMTRADWVRISDVVLTTPYYQSFQSPGATPANWKVNNPDSYKSVGAVKWAFTAATGAADTSAGCAKMDLFNYTDYNQLDELITPSFNLTGLPAAYVNFKVAYAPLSYKRAASGPDVPEALQRTYTDTLVVFASTDCGATWSKVWKKGGTQLATAATLSSNSAGEGGAFTPASSAEWRQEAVDVSQYKNDANVRFMFQTINGWGNAIYLDEVLIGKDEIVSVNEKIMLSPDAIGILPNPTDGNIDVAIRLEANADVRIKVYDVSGRLVAHKNVENLAPNVRIPMNLNDQAAGLYFAHISVNGQTLVKKLIKY